MAEAPDFQIEDPGLPTPGPSKPTPGPSSNPYLAQQREGFAQEMQQDPDLRNVLQSVIHTENPGAGTAVIESLMNRTAMMKEQGHEVSLAQMVGSDNPDQSFYGPVRRGQLGNAYAHIQQNPQLAQKYNNDIDEALAGSNYTQGHTDQGSRGDPNYDAGGVGVNINGERFNDWGGAPGAKEFRERQQRAAFGGDPGTATLSAPEGNGPQPQPSPNPGRAPGPNTIGPYPNWSAAWQAKPGDVDNYNLLSTGGGGFSWVPISKSGPTVPGQPSPVLDPEQSAKIANQAASTGPQTFSGQLGHAFANAGPGFMGGLASSLDLPVELLGKAGNAIAGATGTEALKNQWGTPVMDWMKQHNFQTTPLYDDGWGATIGTYGGQGVGSALPFLAAGALAEPFAGASALARGVARWMGNPGRSVGSALNEAGIAAGAGIGGGEFHDLYKGATGREGDVGDVMTQLVGGGLWNAARVGALTALEKSVGGAWAIKYGSSTPPGTVLNPTTGAALADQVLASNLSDKLSDAARDVAAFHRDPLNSADYLATQSKRAAQAVDGFASGSRADERALWSLVNRDVQVDFSKPLNMWQEMRKDHFDPTNLRDPADWPKAFDNLIGGKGEPGQPQYGIGPTPGLQNIDTLGAGQDLRSRLNYAVEKELSTGASGRVVNAPYLGYLQKIRNSIGEAMETASGATPEELQNLQRAQLFSSRRSTLMESPEMRGFLASGESASLKNLIRQGQEGADAVNVLTSMSAQRYGAQGLLGAAKDSFRQMYSDAVAPNGYVNQAAHDKFMQTYGAYLNEPHFADLKNQFNTAAASEQNANAVVGYGRPGGFGKSVAAGDAHEAAAANYAGAPVDMVLHHLEGPIGSQALATRRLIDQLGEGGTPTAAGYTPAQGGMMHAIAGRVLSDPKYAAKNQAMLQAFDTINPGFSQRALDISKPTSMAGIMKWTQDMTASWIGAHFGSKLGEGMGSSLVLAGRGAEGARTILSTALSKALPVGSASIVDPQAYSALGRLLGKNLSTTTQKVKDMLLFHSYVPGFLADNINNPDNPAGSGLPGSAPRQDALGNVAGSPEWLQELAREHGRLFRGEGGGTGTPPGPPQTGPVPQSQPSMGPR